MITSIKFYDKNEDFIKFKNECSKTGTTEEAIAVGEKIGFKTNLTAINPLNPNQKVPVFLQILSINGLRIWCCIWMSLHDQRDLDFTRKYDLKVHLC